MQEQPKIESDLPVTKDRHGRAIEVGSAVRSFDFPHTDLEGDRACYIEGEVIGVSNDWGDCPRYAIRPTRRVAAGKELPKERWSGETFFPPLNGTHGMHGVQRGVEVLEAVYVARYTIPEAFWSEHGRGGRFPMAQPDAPTEAQVRAAVSECGEELPQETTIEIAGPFENLAAAMLERS